MAETPLSPDFEEKLERLLDVAAEIFADKGYHNTSIRDIAGTAGVSLSGLYYYFDSKDELLFRIQDRCFRTVLAELERRLAGLTDPEERLRTLIRNHVGFFVQHMAAMKVASHEYDSLRGEYRDRIRELRHRYVEITTEILRDLRRATGAGDAVVLRVATFALFGMMNWIYTWYRPGRDVPVDRLSDHLYRVFTSGFVAPADRGAARTEGAARTNPVAAGMNGPGRRP